MPHRRLRRRREPRNGVLLLLFDANAVNVICMRVQLGKVLCECECAVARKSN